MSGVILSNCNILLFQTAKVKVNSEKSEKTQTACTIGADHVPRPRSASVQRSGLCNDPVYKRRIITFCVASYSGSEKKTIEARDI